MHDVIHRHVLDKGIYDDFFLMESITNILAQPRVLDSKPEPVKLDNVKIDYMGGIAASLTKTFGIVQLDESRDAIIDMKGVKITCDLLVMKVLKSLLLVGVSRDPEVSAACREVFLSILKNETSAISTDRMLSKLPRESYYQSELAESIITFCK